MANKQDKGWNCSYCKCNHNFSTRMVCRWCGAKCPSVSRRAHPWHWPAKAPPWWKSDGGQGKDTTADQEDQRGLQSAAEPPSRLELASAKVNEYTNMSIRNTKEEEILAEYKNMLKEEQQKLEESKPVSSYFQRLETTERKSKQQKEIVQKQVTKKKDLLEKTRAELEKLESDLAVAQKELDEATRQLQDARPSGGGEHNSMDTSQAKNFEDYLAQLPAFVGEEAAVEIRQKLTVAVQQRDQDRQQQEEDLAKRREAEEHKRTIEATSSGGTHEVSGRSRQRVDREDDREDGDAKPRRSRSRSNPGNRTAFKKLTKFSKEYTDWQKAKPSEGEEQAMASCIANMPTPPPEAEEDPDCL